MKQQSSSRDSRSPRARSSPRTARAAPARHPDGPPAAHAPQPHADPEFPLSPALDFLQRLWQLNHALEKLSSQMEKRLGVTAPQRMIIRCIGKYPDIAPSQLATVLHLDPGTISATLSRLEDKGFVSRRRDSDDKRRVSLSLTAKGKKLDLPVQGTVENGMERLLAGAPARDIAAARKLFAQLTGHLEDELESIRAPVKRGRRVPSARVARARR